MGEARDVRSFADVARRCVEGRTIERTASGMGFPAITPAMRIITSTTTSSSVSMVPSQYTCKYVGGHSSSSTHKETLPLRATAFVF
jgi:hypothetical protein